jgi:hypothetical protein
MFWVERGLLDADSRRVTQWDMYEWLDRHRRFAVTLFAVIALMLLAVLVAVLVFGDPTDVV